MIKLLRSLVGFNPVQWLKATLRMRRMVRNFQVAATATHSRGVSCGVVVAPWLGTPIPWYSIALGLLLARRGNHVVFLLDDQRFGDKWWRYEIVLSCLRTVMKLVSKHVEVQILSHLDPSPSCSPAEVKEAERLAGLNAVWEMRGEVRNSRRERFAAMCRNQLVLAFPRVHSALENNAFDLLLVPGGVWGTSGLWTYYARMKQLRICSFDCGGYGTVMLAVNGMACQLQDIPQAFRRLVTTADGLEGERAAIAAALAEIAKRKAGSDTFLSQIAGSHDVPPEFDGAILLALNSSWDSAALGLHTVFSDNTDWILGTIRLLLKHTDCPIVVRQHPAERLEIARTSDNYSALLQEHFPGNARVHLVSAHDHINSYELMTRVRALVVYASTIGIEAAAAGIPVITPSNSYYSTLGFVNRAESAAAYLSLLQQAAFGNLSVSEEQRRKALLCFYLTQCCNWVFSPFNPGDFRDWGGIPLTEWERDANVMKMMDAIENNIPVALLNHLDRQKSNPAGIGH